MAISPELSALLDRREGVRCDALFRRLDTPVDVRAELADSPDPTAAVFRFLSRATALVGLFSLSLIFAAAPEDRVTVVAYVAVTLGLSVGLRFVRGAGGRAALGRST